MTPENQRIAISEACGTRKSLRSGWPLAPSELPDYLGDLNAMHEAEKVILGKDGGLLCRKYFDNLGLGYGLSSFGKIHATAAQRAEAFLKTLGLWRDDGKA